MRRPLRPPRLKKPLRARRDKPIRIRVEDALTAAVHSLRCPQPVRLGYGRQCELKLDGEGGPEVLVELRRAEGPLKLTTPVDPGELRNHVDLAVDDRPLESPVHELRPGSRVEVLDKATDRRYRLIVDPPSRWSVRPRALALVMLILVLVGGVYGGYLYWSLRGAETRLAQTEQRLAEAESGIARARSRLAEAIRGMETTKGEIAGTIEAFQQAQSETERRLRDDFDRRFEELGERAQRGLAALSEEDVRAREQLANELREDIALLQRELSEKMVEAYRESKQLEDRVRQSLASRIAALEPPGEQFKRVLAARRQGVVFINTRYTIEIIESGETNEYDAFGTGFLIGPFGRGLTAQHVLYPWRHERPYLVLSKLGLVRVIPDSVQWSMWLTGDLVRDAATEPPTIHFETAYQNTVAGRAVRVLYAPPAAVAEDVVASPAGLVTVSLPVPGATDVAVFQLMEFDRALDPLEFADPAAPVEALDEVLVIGYPFSRLLDGHAVPQGVRGFVRRVGLDLMELDTPFHPGLSGAPVFDRRGGVIGMAIAVMESEVYGMAARGADLRRVLDEATAAVRAEEERLADRGCDPGPIDGVIDRQAWAAYRCETNLPGGP